jgi:hypothetical protein
MADLRACPRCHGLVDASMRTCPICGRWLGHGSLLAWLGLVVIGGLVVLLGFFLPWISGLNGNVGTSLSGLDLAQLAQHLKVTSRGDRPTAAVSIALYLVPSAALGAVVLVLLAWLARWPWTVIGRFLVGLGTIALQLSLLVAVVSAGLERSTVTIEAPQPGLLITALGSLLIIGGGVALGGPGRLFKGARG